MDCPLPLYMMDCPLISLMDCPSLFILTDCPCPDLLVGMPIPSMSLADEKLYYTQMAGFSHECRANGFSKFLLCQKVNTPPPLYTLSITYFDFSLVFSATRTALLLAFGWLGLYRLIETIKQVFHKIAL